MGPLVDHSGWVHSLTTAGDATKKKNRYPFTDDTAMARSVAASLIQYNGFHVKDMATRFASEFNSEPKRGYGGNVITVFRLLSDPDLQDYLEPARLQFGGQGSYGNGGAMRIAPAALFTYNNDADGMTKLVTQITEITHTHVHAIHGSILLSLAVHQALHMDTSSQFDTGAFIGQLKCHMSTLESATLTKCKESPDSTPSKRMPKTTNESEKEEKPYCYKLDKIKEYLKQKTEVSVDELEEVLGNDVSALGSVPAAIFAFLRATQPMSGELQERNGFEKTIIYAISLRGDTDTIATMAGAIAGAYYGLDDIPHLWQNCCEGVGDAMKFADDLEKIVSKS